MIREYLKIGFENLKHRKLRSLLTVLGIVIGIGAIVGLVIISQGLENAVVEQFEKIGTDKIYVTPKAFVTGNIPQGLTNKDVETLEGMNDFDFVTPFLISSGNIEFGRETEFIFQIAGYPSDDTEKRLQDIDIGLESGRYFKKGEKFVAIVGHQFAHDLFDKEVRVNSPITIKDRKFRVIGVFESIGNTDDDTAAYIPLDTAREIFDKQDEVSVIELNLKDGLDVNEVADRVERKLKRARDDEDFTILTPEQALETFGVVLGIIQVVLGGIAAISLLVGAIGIMSSMLTSVLERKREIGIMKSVGARNSRILLLFLFESGIIGVVGGFLGILFGSLLAKAVGLIAAAAGFQLLLIRLNPWVLLGGLLFSIIVSILSGIFPAYQAARLQPVEAMRE